MTWWKKYRRAIAIVLAFLLWASNTLVVRADIDTTPMQYFYEGVGPVEFNAQGALYYQDNWASSIYIEKQALSVVVLSGTVACSWWQVIADGFQQAGAPDVDPPLTPGMSKVLENYWWRTFNKSDAQPFRSWYGAGSYACSLGWPTAGWEMDNFTDGHFEHYTY